MTTWPSGRKGVGSNPTVVMIFFGNARFGKTGAWWVESWIYHVRFTIWRNALNDNLAEWSKAMD